MAIVFVALFAVLAWTAVGLFMIYSAITGKGISRPEDSATWDIRVQYFLRGFIGFAFTIFGLYMLYSIINEF